MTNYSDATRTALDALSRIKAPTKRAAFIAETMTTLPTLADVTDFATALRTRAGVQDLTMLPDTEWTVERSGDVAPKTTVRMSTGELRRPLDLASDVTISWPNVLFHWGVMVTFALNGNRYVARSADYAPTETYMSS